MGGCTGVRAGPDRRPEAAPGRPDQHHHLQQGGCHPHAGHRARLRHPLQRHVPGVYVKILGFGAQSLSGYQGSPGEVALPFSCQIERVWE